MPPASAAIRTLTTGDLRLVLTRAELRRNAASKQY